MIFARCFHLKINCKQYVAWWSCSLPEKYTLVKYARWDVAMN